jgi:hypothetical protein
VQASARAFGSRVVMYDGTFNTNKESYPLNGAVVVNEQGCAVPICFGISSSQAAETMQRHLALMQERLFAGRQPPIIVDKGSSETAALRALHWSYYLCAFHFLQVWRKWLRSSESRIPAAAASAIMAALIKLAGAATVDEFKSQLDMMEHSFSQYPQIFQKLQADWLPEASRWVPCHQAPRVLPCCSCLAWHQRLSRACCLCVYLCMLLIVAWWPTVVWLCSRWHPRCMSMAHVCSCSVQIAAVWMLWMVVVSFGSSSQRPDLPLSPACL